MRPVDIEADVKEMERRKRVEAIMNSQVDGDGGDDQDDDSNDVDHDLDQEERSF